MPPRPWITALRAALSVALLALPLVAGCDDTPDGPSRGGIAEPCESDEQCFEGLRCIGGVCLACALPCGSSCCTVGEERCEEGLCVPLCAAELCGEVCCAPSERCHTGICCPRRSVCGAECCGPQQQCADGAGCVTCLTPLCGEAGLCCGDGEQCLDGACCPAERVCGGTCCGGDERCLDGVCTLDCGDRARCEGGETCCGDGEVCYLDTCTTPGAPCDRHGECREDEYCEPAIGRCLALADEGSDCEYHPPTDLHAPVVEWHWAGYSLNGEYRNVLSLPLVGDVDGDGLPEVVALAYRSNDIHEAIAVVLEGEDGSEHLVIDDPTLRFDGSAHGALADIDGDGRAEMALPLSEGGFALLDDDGAVLWSINEGSAATALYAGAIALGDLDGDGAAELVYGGAVVSASGALLADHGPLGSNWDTTDGRRSVMPTLYDLNGDGALDLVAGGRVIDGAGAGETLWQRPAVPDGFTAVADVDGSGTPDVVVVADGVLWVLSGADGETLFTRPLPEGEDAGCLDENRGGPPTIADFDLDGEVEIGVASCSAYAVLDLACAAPGDPVRCATGSTDGALWVAATRDHSSSATGSSVFDFEADGAAEVVYNDECFLRIYDGGTGRVLFEAANTTRTATEYPVIADVDADGSAEIVVAANEDQIIRDACEVGTSGVFAWGDALHNWVRTRPLWNEHTYHVTNVTDDGAVPAEEAPNHATEGLNNFRQNVQTEGIFSTSNLVPEDVDALLSYCPSRWVLRARVVNLGSAGVGPGVPVGFYREDLDGSVVLLGVASTEGPLLPGASEVVSVSYEPLESDLAELTFFVVVDDALAGGVEVAVHECDEDDNESAPVTVECLVVG